MAAQGFFDFQDRLRKAASDEARPQSPVEPEAGSGDDRGGSPKPGPQSRQAMSVFALSNLIDEALKDRLPRSVHVRGEVSRYNLNSQSGHAYFTLKDAQASIDCVIFRSALARVKFRPTDGTELIASGEVRVYVQRGRYQLYVSSLTPVGQGALELALQQLRERLEKEGLFAQDRKRPIPAYPRTIAIVTSREAAALADIRKVLAAFPFLKIYLLPVPVQGEGAALRIAGAIATASAEAKKRGIELIILARGGGSLEDLWEFNDEKVARAIVASSIPVVTGIGHEIDVSIADLAADYHAHTPTEAAQIATRNWRRADALATELSGRMRRALVQIARNARHQLARFEQFDLFKRPMDLIDRRVQRLDDHQQTMALSLSRRTGELRARLARAESSMQRHHPFASLTVARGRVEAAAQRLRANLLNTLRMSRAALLAVGGNLRSRQIAQLSRLAERTAAVERHLRAIGPAEVLARGYSITRNAEGRLVTSVSAVKPGDRLETVLRDGTVESTAGRVTSAPSGGKTMQGDAPASKAAN